MSSPLPPVDGTRRAPAPRVGAPNTFGAKAARMKRQQKLGMWSAVALQQHFALSGGAQALTSAAGGPNSDGRCERTPLQSLPAAVVAYPTSRLPSNTTHGQHRADEDGSRPRLTLAQKMNLVPAPPPPPTEDDWHAVETRALLRAQHEYEDARAAAAAAAATAAGRQVTHHHHSSSSTAAFASFAAQVCSICRDPFCFAAGSPSLASRHQGFVILSCSHVFHETCFRQFERLIRLQQRAEAAAALSSGGASVGALMTRLACPECRSTNYFKRTYFSGPAMAERAALVRIQAVVRGFLARRRWRAARLRSNPQFRDAFVESRLTRLANAWDRCLTRQANQREALLLSLDVQRQEAAAAFLSESEWQDIIEKRLGMSCTDATSTPSCSCAICLEDVQCALRPSQALMLRRRGRHGSRSSSPPSPQPSTTIATDTDPAAAAAASVVAEMRANYEERRAATRKGKAKPTRRDGGRPLARHRGARHTPAKCSRDRGNAQVDTEGERPASVNPNNAKNNDPASSSPRVESPELSADACVPGPRASPRYGVILSCCGQVFHEACLEVLERYTERNATTSASNTASAADGGPVPFQRRCPLCRRGYGKHAF